MNVIVCDDDKATRFAVKRILTQHFGVSITECSDGLEALEAISKGSFHFMLLDIEMPTMSGIEVLELLRESDTGKDLPVVVLSNVRDGEAIAHLVKLGVADYILKPPRTDKLVSKIQRLLKVLPKSPQSATDGTALRLSPDCPALVVDGSLDFRFALVNELQPYGPVLEVESGAAAMARFRLCPVGLVFVGQDLGVVGPELLVRKLRQLSPSGPLRIVGMVADMSLIPTGLFDDVIQRSLLPGMLSAALRPFVTVSGPLNSLRALVPDLIELANSTAAQAFGMMVEEEVTASDAEGPVEAAANAFVVMDLAGRFDVTLGVHFSTPVASRVASKMFGSAEADVTDEDRTAVAGEICTLVAGRVSANLRERGLASDCPPPTLTGLTVVAAADPGCGMLSRLRVGDVGEFHLSLTVVDRNASHREAAKETPTSAPEKPVEASTLAPAETPPETPAEALSAG